MDEKLKLFLEELNIQARCLGGLLQYYDMDLGFCYRIGYDSNWTADRFSESDIISYILNETNYGTKMIDMKTLVSKFIEKDVEAEYWFIDAIDEFEIVKDMNPTGSENKDCISRKVMNGDYSLYFYFLAVKTGEKYIVTEKMLRKMRVSKEEFLDKYGSKAKWNPQSRMRITRAGDCCYSIVPMESFLSNMRISSRTLNRLSKRLGNEPFFILYDASLNAVALEARYEELKKHNPSGEFVMSDKCGIRLRTSWIRRRLYAICRELGFEREKGPHTCRRTYATILLDNNVDKNLIMDQMGHTDISCTEKYYHEDMKSLDTKIKILSGIPDFAA